MRRKRVLGVGRVFEFLLLRRLGDKNEDSGREKLPKFVAAEYEPQSETR